MNSNLTEHIARHLAYAEAGNSYAKITNIIKQNTETRMLERRLELK